MSDLVISICVEEDGCEAVAIKDTTGKYSSANPTGFGAPNIGIANVTDAWFEFTPPGKDPDTEFIKTNSIFPDFPTLEDVQYEVLAESLGLKKFCSGTWTIRMVVVDNNGAEYKGGDQFVLFNSAKCCIKKAMAKINRSNLLSPESQAYLELSRLLEVAEWAACECKNFTQANDILSYINEQCKCCV